MATPTSARKGLQGRTPSQQGPTPSQLAGATPAASTPFSNPAQAAFSPRAQRSPQQVKKSPALSAMMMAQPSGGAFNFDSPSTAAAMGVLGGFDIGLDAVGVGVAGLDPLGVGYSGEDDKLKRLDLIVEMLNQKKGLVSEAGLERLAQRLGLELLSEEHSSPGGGKTKTLAIAGSAISLDIVLDNNIVQNVSLAYHGSAPSVSRDIEAASQILLRDLQLAPGQSPLTKTLDKFASNFEQFATLDKLSVVPGLDCYEALSGIYTSLQRLFEWDLARLREDVGMGGRTIEYLSSMAMCTRHGHPVMHARNRVGLALQYWRELRFFPPSSDVLSAYAEEEEKVWSLLLGCAPIDALDRPPVRVSEDWISKDVVKPSLDPTKPMLDWLEPDDVSLPPSESPEQKNAVAVAGAGAGMDVEVLQLDLTTMPRVMFTVTFDPPVILPQNDWIRLYAYANASPPNPNPNPSPSSDFGTRPPAPPPTFDSLFFPIPSGSKQAPSDSRTITRLRDVRILDQHDRTASVRSHRNTLFIYKPIYSQVVTEMSFSHPQQLIDMLPLLRQFAFLSTLLNNSFGPKTRDDPASSDVKTTTTSNSSNSNKSNSNRPSQSQSDEKLTRTAGSQLDDFMGPSDPDPPPIPYPDATSSAPGTAEDRDSSTSGSGSGCMDLDVILWVHPAPHLQVVFPMRGSTVNITLRILEGGTVEIVHENVLPQDNADGMMAGNGKGKGRQLTREDLGRVLEHLEDLCKWAEWIRTRLS